MLVYVIHPPTQTKSYTRDIYYGNSDFDGSPVIYVNWDMAKTYCEWVDRRLPNEAEWEKAAHGTDVNDYPWGDTFDGSLVNFCDTNCPFDLKHISFNDGFADTSPVGNYPNGASSYGALDMAGNVWEWMDDLYEQYPGNTFGYPDSGTIYRVLRGGSWGSNDQDVRSVNRYLYSFRASYNGIGFRCAMSAIP